MEVHVDHPSCDDLVLSCGGTQIKSGKDAVPSYQAKAKLPVSLDNKKRGRGVPDIAMSAAGYFTRVDTTESATGGGTSAVAPLMAALVARLNQAKKKNVGFLNPFLYANVRKGVVHDVTSGTNAIKDTIKGYRQDQGGMRALASEHQMELPS
jgi:kumamolisin